MTNIHLATAWSTDTGKQGLSHIYYSTAEKITGPNGPRKFVGQSLSHGTTAVPLEVKTPENGEIDFRARVLKYLSPGPNVQTHIE